MQRQDGFLPIYADAARGRILMEVPKLNQEMIYFVTIAKGYKWNAATIRNK